MSTKNDDKIIQDREMRYRIASVLLSDATPDQIISLSRSTRPTGSTIPVNPLPLVSETIKPADLDKLIRGWLIASRANLIEQTKAPVTLRDPSGRVIFSGDADTLSTHCGDVALAQMGERLEANNTPQALENFVYQILNPLVHTCFYRIVGKGKTTNDIKDVHPIGLASGEHNAVLFFSHLSKYAGNKLLANIDARFIYVVKVEDLKSGPDSMQAVADYIDKRNKASALNLRVIQNWDKAAASILSAGKRNPDWPESAKKKLSEVLSVKQDYAKTPRVVLIHGRLDPNLAWRSIFVFQREALQQKFVGDHMRDISLEGDKVLAHSLHGLLNSAPVRKSFKRSVAQAIRSGRLSKQGDDWLSGDTQLGYSSVNQYIGDVATSTMWTLLRNNNYPYIGDESLEGEDYSGDDHLLLNTVTGDIYDQEGDILTGNMLDSIGNSLAAIKNTAGKGLAYLEKTFPAAAGMIKSGVSKVPVTSMLQGVSAGIDVAKSGGDANQVAEAILTPIASGTAGAVLTSAAVPFLGPFAPLAGYLGEAGVSWAVKTLGDWYRTPDSPGPVTNACQLPVMTSYLDNPVGKWFTQSYAPLLDQVLKGLLNKPSAEGITLSGNAGKAYGIAVAKHGVYLVGCVAKVLNGEKWKYLRMSNEVEITTKDFDWALANARGRDAVLDELTAIDKRKKGFDESRAIGKIRGWLGGQIKSTREAIAKADPDLALRVANAWTAEQPFDRVLMAAITEKKLREAPVTPPSTPEPTGSNPITHGPPIQEVPLQPRPTADSGTPQPTPAENQHSTAPTSEISHSGGGTGIIVDDTGIAIPFQPGLSYAKYVRLDDAVNNAQYLATLRPRIVTPGPLTGGFFGRLAKPLIKFAAKKLLPIAGRALERAGSRSKSRFWRGALRGLGKGVGSLASVVDIAADMLTPASAAKRGLGLFAKFGLKGAGRLGNLLGKFDLGNLMKEGAKFVKGGGLKKISPKFGKLLQTMTTLVPGLSPRVTHEQNPGEEPNPMDAPMNDIPSGTPADLMNSLSNMQVGGTANTAMTRSAMEEID